MVNRTEKVMVLSSQSDEPCASAALSQFITSPGYQGHETCIIWVQPYLFSISYYLKLEGL